MTWILRDTGTEPKANGEAWNRMETLREMEKQNVAAQSHTEGARRPASPSTSSPAIPDVARRAPRPSPPSRLTRQEDEDDEDLCEDPRSLDEQQSIMLSNKPKCCVSPARL